MKFASTSAIMTISKEGHRHLHKTTSFLKLRPDKRTWYFDDFLEAKDLGHYSTFLFVHKKKFLTGKVWCKLVSTINDHQKLF